MGLKDKDKTEGGIPEYFVISAKRGSLSWMREALYMISIRASGWLKMQEI